MNNLPTEIILAIVKNANKKDLYALTLVNGQFNSVSTPLLWRSVELQSKEQLIQFLQGAILSRYRFLEHLRNLTIDHDYALDDLSLLSLIPLLPTLLDELEIVDATNITDASFNYLPQQCPHLTSLSLREASITHQSIVSVGQHCHQLRNIDLESEHLSHHVFATLAACPLETIRLNGSWFTADIGDDDDVDTSLRTMAHDLVVGFPRMEFLNMEVFDFRELVATIKLHSPWPNLTVFNTQFCHDADDRDVMAFIRADPHIKDLQLSDNYFSDDVFQVIADTLPGLTTLDLSQSRFITHHGVRSIITQCPLLKSFDIYDTNVMRTDFPELTLVDDVTQQHDSTWGILSVTEMESIRRTLVHNRQQQ